MSCHIGVNNLDLLVLLIKNWFDNPCAKFEDDGPQNVDVFGDVEGNLLDVFDMEFPNEVGGYVEEEDVQNWELHPQFWTLPLVIFVIYQIPIQSFVGNACNMDWVKPTF